MSDAHIAGWLLIAAATSSLIAATMPSLARSSVWMLPLPDYFRVIAAHETQWRAHSWLFAVGTLLMGLGLTFAGRTIGSGLVLASLFLYVMVAPLWLAHLAFRLDLTVKAARDESARGLFDALGHWAGSLYTIFMVGSYVSIALLGGALIESQLVPAWTAGVLVVFGSAAAVSHWTGWPRIMGMRGAFDLPVLVQLVPLFVAIPLAAGG